MNSLRTMRESQKISQDQLAKQIHVDRSTIAKWETGVALPNAAKLPLLASVLDCTIDELFGRAPPDRAGRESA